MGQQIRIQEMEHRLDEALEAVHQLDKALSHYEAIQDHFAILATYLNSDEWRQDLADDERGFLPPDLRRGVLSEDGIWNLLDDNTHLARRMQSLANRLLPKDDQPPLQSQQP